MPTISSIAPAAGPDEGGTEITVTGTGFLDGPPEIDLDGLLATDVQVTSDTDLRCIAPWELAIEPVKGKPEGGTDFTIKGRNFVPGDSVTIGGNPATDLAVIDSRTIVGKTPAGTLGEADVSVVKSGETITRKGAYTYSNEFEVSWYHSRDGAAIGDLTVYVVAADGTILQTLFTISGDAGTNAWELASAAAQEPGQTHRIAWRHDALADLTGDLAVDTIEIDGVLYDFEAGDNGFLTSSGVNTTDPVTALANSIALPTTTAAVAGQWNRNSGGTGSSNTGPSSAQGGDWYAYTETSSPNDGGTTFWLFSPERI